MSGSKPKRPSGQNPATGRSSDRPRASDRPTLPRGIERSLTPRTMRRATPTPRPFARPIPREEPGDDEGPASDGTTGQTLEVAAVVEYDALRDGMAVGDGDDPVIDEELAIQAEVVRVAIGRRTGKPPKT